MGSLDTSRSADQLQEAATSIADRVSTKAEQIGQRVSQAAEKISDRAGGALTTAQEKSAAAANSANDVAVTLRDALAQSARNQPITTISLAAGAGFLLGVLWKSGR